MQHKPGNPSKLTLVQIIFKDSVCTSKRTPHFTTTKINWITLFKEIIAVCSEEHTKTISTKYSVADCYLTTTRL
jgi:hypothetical protein